MVEESNQHLVPQPGADFFMTILQARKLLGKKYKKYSDNQIEQTLNQFYGLAELLLDEAILNGSNKQAKVIDHSIRKINNVKRSKNQ